MGCANSKGYNSRRHKDGADSPMRRSVTLYPKYHLEESAGDGHIHVVGRTSTSLGSFRREDSFVQSRRRGVNGNGNGNAQDEKSMGARGQLVTEKCGVEDERKDRFSVGITEAKTWSSLMNERIPKLVPQTPTRTPTGEPESINLWELMEGLEDTSPLINHCKSFSFDVAGDPETAFVSLPIGRPKSMLGEIVKESSDTGQLASNELSFSKGADLSEGPENVLSCSEAENDRCSPKPKWLEMNSVDTVSLPDFDPEIISMFRKSLENLSPDNPFYTRPKAPVTSEDDDEQLQALAVDTKDKEHFPFQSIKKDRVVVYFTSLRGIRKTYEDCCHVRVILKGLGVRVDEKDLSMHSGFKEELKELLGDRYGAGGLPRVFIGKKYIGGADEIRRLHEDEELEKLLQGCEMVDNSVNGGNTACEACGDIRFIPCNTCSGSCKIFHDCDEDEDGAESLQDDGFGFHRCPNCNENGLIRCPLCCD
ncbi:hypothetical protein QQ045_008603 [Rhodiola kirilowii]